MASRSLVEILLTLKDEASEGLGKLLGLLGGVSNAVLSLGGIVVATVGAIVGLAEHLASMWSEEELVIARLNAALRVSGTYTEEGSRAIQEMADKMLETTMHSKEEALGVSATFASLARELTAQQLADAQKLAIGLADATGKSVEGASLMIVRSLTGQGNALKRWGVDLDTAGTQQEKFNRIQQKLGPLFRISEEQTNTLAGAVAQIKNNWHDLEQELGQVIARSLGLTDVAHTVRDAIREATKYVKEHMEEWIRYIRTIPDGFAVVGAVISAVVTTVYGGLLIMVNGLASVLLGAFGLIEKGLIWVVNTVVIGGLNQLFGAIDDFMSLFGSSFDFRIGKIANGTNVFTRASQEMADRVKDQMKIVSEAWAEVGDKVDIVNRKMNAPLPPPPAQAGAGDNIGTHTDISDEEALRRADEQLKTLEAKFAAGKISSAEYMAGIAALRAEFERLSHSASLTPAELAKIYQALAKIHGIVPDIGKSIKEAFGLQAGGGLAALKEADATVAKMANTMGHAFTDAIAQAIIAHANFGETVKKAVGKAAAAESAHAFGLAIFELAAGFASSFINPAESAGHFKASATYAIAGASLAALGGLTGGFSGGAGGGGGGGGAANRTESVSSLAKMAGEVQVFVPTAISTDPAFIDWLVGTIEQASGKRVTVQPGA